MEKRTIRPAVLTDMPAIAAIYAHEVLHGLATFEARVPEQEELSARWQAIVNSGFPYLVAEVAGSVVGYAYANTYRPRAAYRYSVENSVYVDKDHQGIGVGRGLLKALVRQCEQSGFRQMIAVIGDSGNAASIALHTGLGFRRVGVLYGVGYKLGNWVDTVIMQRDLTGADPIP